MPRKRRVSHGSAMQLTRAADYAIRALIHLAQLPEIHRVPLNQLAQATAAPGSFLSKVMQSLGRGGYVTSRRGQIGGFTLLPRGRAASVAAVVEFIDGPCTLNVCLSTGVSCSRRSWCPAHPVWAAAQDALLSVLRAHTIAELAARVPAPSNPLIQL